MLALARACQASIAFRLWAWNTGLSGFEDRQELHWQTRCEFVVKLKQKITHSVLKVNEISGSLR